MGPRVADRGQLREWWALRLQDAGGVGEEHGQHERDADRYRQNGHAGASHGPYVRHRRSRRRRSRPEVCREWGDNTVKQQFRETTAGVEHLAQ